MSIGYTMINIGVTFLGKWSFVSHRIPIYRFNPPPKRKRHAYLLHRLSGLKTKKEFPSY